MTAYAPLHLHSHYTLLEGTSRVADLLKLAQEAGCPAMALTDHGVMYGAIELVSNAPKYGIKPIVGCELSVVDGDHTERTKQSMYRVVLLAANLTGYQNLVKLSSIANLEGFYYRPRINWDLLERHNEGLILLTADLTGPLSHHILRGQHAVAEERLVWLKTVFGDRLYLELQDHGMDTEKTVNMALAQLGLQHGVPCVIAHDVRFNRPEDRIVHEVLQCLKDGKTLNDPSRTSFYNEHYCFKSGDVLATEAFRYFEPEYIEACLQRSIEVAERCQLELPLGQTYLPDYPMDDHPGKTSDELLREVVYDHARKRYGQELSSEVTERLDFELGVIQQMGFPTYFLIVWDFINYARTNGIPVGPGRGSAAGSLVAFVLGITNIDPLEHNLLFERFLNPERVSMPDIDIDFCIDRRADVIDYVTQRYGRERVCQIATFGTLAARASVKAVARVKELPFAESDRLAKMIPATPGTTLNDALVEGAPLKKACDDDPSVAELVTLARKLEGLAFNIGIHAAGVVISKLPLMDILPLQLGKEKATQSTPPVITQCPMSDVEKIGLLKMDFLGLRNLTIIHHTLDHIERMTGQRIDLDNVPLNDPKVYELLTAGETDGVFQLESSGMKALMQDLKPSVFEDINALVALYRPGPLNSGMAKKFVDRKHGREKIAYQHPGLEPILSSTYGTIVYQEQIMQIAQVLANYSLGRADLLRRAMGKKKAEIMEKEREGFVKGGVENGVDETLLNELFDTMSEFAAYCFNRSHSAAYAFVAYQTAYLKVHYPVAYLSALLSSVSHDIDKIQFYLLTARKMGVKVLPPDVTSSAVDFQPEGDDAIRFGLASIKGVGEGVIQTLIEERNKKPFTTLADFFERVSPKVMNRKTLEGLIACGAFNTLHPCRKQLMNNIEVLTNYAAQSQKQAESGQVSLFAALGGDDGGGGGGFEALRLHGSCDDEFTQEEIQQYEKSLMGFYVTSHPLDHIRDRLPVHITHTVMNLKEVDDGAEVIVGGLLQQATMRMTKTGRPLISGVLEDLTGSVEFVVFGDDVPRLETQLREGACAILKARVQFRSATGGGGGGDESSDSQAPSLIVADARPIQDATPLWVRFVKLPDYADLAHLGKTLRQLSPAVDRTPEPPQNAFRRGRPPSRIGGLHPVVFELPTGEKIQASPRFWLDQLTPDILSQLHQDVSPIATLQQSHVGLTP